MNDPRPGANGEEPPGAVWGGSYRSTYCCLRFILGENMEHKVQTAQRFPCKGCETRHGGCHATCEKYKTAKAVYEAEKAERDKMKAVQNRLNEYTADEARKNRRRSGRKWNGKEGAKRY